MTDLKAVAQQALEALEDMLGWQSLAPQTIQEAAKGRAAALRAALVEPQSTHSAECYQWHHKCAVAEVERLRLLCEEMLSELYVYRASKQLKDVTAAIRARGNR